MLESSDPADLGSTRRLAIGKVALVVALATINFCDRWHRAQTMPLADRHNYEETYAYSLSLLAGKGFHNLAVPPTPEAEPIAQFLAKQSDHVSREQFETFLAHPGAQDYDADAGEHNFWASSRILDQYVVAGLWRVFGIRWQAVFLFAAAMSTLSCLFVFLIARRIGGNYWTGVIAAVLYFASPLGSYLETWSLRDASPLWFAAAGFWFLFCVVDRGGRLSTRGESKSTSQATWLTGRWVASSAALGIVAMIGIGWRPDVLLLVVYLGFALLVMSRVRGLSWKSIAASGAAYIAGAIFCHAAIFALSSERVLDPQNGFQNAVYADFSRSNLLQIENTFQIQRCDRATLFLARQYDQAHHPGAAPLAYKGPGFSQDCRAIFLQQMRYNAFHWLAGFPAVYWKALNGLIVPDAFETRSFKELKQDRLPALQWLHRSMLNGVSQALPWFFLFGVAAALLLRAADFGRGRTQAVLLVGLSIVHTAALLLVLPEQKHCGVLLLPLTVLGAIGIRTAIALLQPAHWKQLFDRSFLPARRTWITAGAAVAAAFALSLAICYVVSKHERANLIAAIQSAARTGKLARETLHGDKVFSVRWLPGDTNHAVGYLLKLSPASKSTTLVCRQVHFPQDWCWARVLETTHVLRPNREQYFFVTCDQGEEYGDPRPYSCSVTVEGESRIESCQRIDLSGWKRLPVSTVFCEGDSSPGSPRSIAGNSIMRWPNWPAQRSLADDDWRTAQRDAHDSLFVGPQPPAPRCRPLEHLVARSSADGNFQIAISDGRKFLPGPFTYQSPKSWSNLVSGDFTGDGMEDLLGRSRDGSWWLGSANGNAATFRKITFDLPNSAIDYIGVGDFNGDGIDDVAIRLTDGSWWIGLSDGVRFQIGKLPRWPANVAPQNICIGDFNGDGRADIAGFDPKTRQWIVSTFDGAAFLTNDWGALGSGAGWRHILAADFNGDGRTDVAAWNPATGEWMLGQSDGKRFVFHAAGTWPTDADWQFVSTGRFTADSRCGIVGFDRKSGRIAIATLEKSEAAQGATPKLVTRILPGNAAFARGMFVGCFNGDERDNFAAVDSGGAIWLGILDRNSIRYEKWGTWPNAAHLDDMRVMSFWRQESQGAAKADSSRPIATAAGPNLMRTAFSDRSTAIDPARADKAVRR